MIFSVSRHIDMIRNGLLRCPTLYIPPRYVKTQTRRLNRGIYQVGRDYAVQRKRGGKAEADIRIVMDRIWEEHGPITMVDAMAEGGYCSRSFEFAFKILYSIKEFETRWAFEFHAIEVHR